MDSLKERLDAMRPGRPWPLGAHVEPGGVNFAVFSAFAQTIELCVYDDAGGQELGRRALPGHTGDVFHGWLPEAAAGLVYGLRAYGPWRPERGHRFNPNKVLLDPYAREIVGDFEWRDEHFGADLTYTGHMDMAENGPWALKARVVADDFDWQGDSHPYRPLDETVLYEVHVKGFTRAHPGVPEAQRGTYAGLASDAALAHLRRLGVTAVSLLPVHQHIDEQRLVEHGLVNYWGYNTIGFFAPEPRLAAARDGRGARDEFREMVRRLHAAGLEVILDVVYNHTAEGDHTGPTISFRGLDNASYYRLSADSRAFYENLTGTGNTFDLRQARTLQLVMDSLRYWASEMHVDGFRFDLATVLGRGDDSFEPHAGFFSAIAQDPLLSTLKMIAEPWDIGPGGYQVGGFPRGWLEWNDRFRDSMRTFWVKGSLWRGDFAQRLCGSSDIYQPTGRAPAESVNYIVSHDGFTLADLVSYRRRHNEANGEGNCDGQGDNHSDNFGVEGPSDDAAVRDTRSRVARALLATLLLSQGTPMLCAGDELGRTQQGNNNAYCQDNEIGWIDWAQADDALITLCARILSLRRQAGVFSARWHDGLPDRNGLPDLTWLRADGQAMHTDDWSQSNRQVLGCLVGHPGRMRAPLLLLFNAEDQHYPFPMPGGAWEIVLHTLDAREHGRWVPGAVFDIPPRSVLALAAGGHDLRF